MPRICFLPDSPIDEEGNTFRALLAELGLNECDVEIGADPEAGGYDYVAFVGKERARARFGDGTRTGRQEEKLGGGAVFVLPSTALKHRGRFFQGVWVEFASLVLGRDLAVRDEFKGLAPAEIKRQLDERRFPFAVLAANLVYDFNIGTLIRNANAFLAREILIYGRRRYDRRAAMGAHHYMDIEFLSDPAALDAHIESRGYHVVVFEETPDATPIAEFEWPQDPLMVFGQEGPGVPDILLARADSRVSIPLYGSMRSINVGVASGIAMNDWHSKRG
ncbi:MAG: TrmH family RNA methyltransferase [Planctomycetota bacterium]